MGKKGRKKAKALKKKSPEEEKAEIVAILMTKCGKEEEEVISKTKVGISRNLKSWDFQEALLPNPLLQVLKAWDIFHDMYPDGFVSREDFLASRSVILNFKIIHLY